MNQYNLDEKSKFNFEIPRSKIPIINSTHDPDSFKDIDNHLRISIKDDKRLVTFN